MRQRIRQFLLSNFLFTDDDSKLSDADSLLEQGIMDSTGVLELVAFLETELGLQVADRDLSPENLDSVDRIVAFAERNNPALTPSGR
jgi:acyl carrier protein